MRRSVPWLASQIVLLGAFLAGGLSALGWGVHDAMRTPSGAHPGSVAAQGSMAMGTMLMPPPASAASSVSVTSLTGPQTAAHTDTFTLTAQPARISLGTGTTVSAWTFNGT